jgi:tetratricopeptide (TPR) repeat protein
MAAVAVGGQAQAQAEDDGAAARALFEQGRTAYERELFTEAEDDFLAAYEAMAPDDPRRPLILLNVAQAIERQGGRDEDALEAWRRFEREARDVADASVLLRASERIRELEARLRRRTHEEEEVDDETEVSPAVEAPPPEEPGFSPHWSGIVVTGVGGAAILAGAIVGIAGLAKKSSVLDMCEGTVCAPEARDDADRLDGLALGADLLLWPGLALAAAGVVLMFTVSSADDDEETTVTASCGLGGCMVGGTF